MESLYNLFKVLVCLYLGAFTYLVYQILFFHQKRLLLTKTLLFFGTIAVVLIRVSHRYHIILLSVYLLFFLWGIYLARKFFHRKIIDTNRKITDLFQPVKKKLFLWIKKASIPFFYPYIQRKIQLHRYYKRHPYERPKSIYELF